MRHTGKIPQVDRALTVRIGQNLMETSKTDPLLRKNKSERWSIFTQLMFYAVACACIFFFSLPVYSSTHRMLACAVIVSGFWPLLQYFRFRRVGVPLLEIPLASFPVLFAFPLLYHEEQFVYGGQLVPTEDGITKTLFAVVLAIVFLQVGYHCASRKKLGALIPRITMTVPDRALAFLGAGLVLMNVVLNITLSRLSEDLLRLFQVLISADLGIAILGILFYQRKLSPFFVWSMWAALGLLTLIGLSTGMTQSALQPLFVFALTRWIVKGLLPVASGIFLMIVFFILQPVKMEYREQTWYGREGELSAVDKSILYANIAFNQWTSFAKDHGNVGKSIQDSAVQRISLLLTTQQYVILTPSVIPYKQGESIWYLFYGWIPRILWPGKPIAGEANKNYPVEYGLQHPNSVGKAVFGVGHVGEAYVNFGMVGIPPLFFLLGFLTRMPQLMFYSPDTSPGALAIQCFACINLMFVGGSISNVYGGLITGVIAQIFLLFGAKAFYQSVKN